MKIIDISLFLILLIYGTVVTFRPLIKYYFCTVMINKGDKAYSVLNNKCPRCHEGDFFVNNSSFNFKGFSKMHEKCQKCGLSFEQEPGYYFGAMYVSYAINVAIMVSVWVAFLVLVGSDFNVWWMIAVSIVLGLVLTPLTFRLSRLGWINFFVRYRGLES